jgi:DNA-binding NarL/FixJ family response regulator
MIRVVVVDDHAVVRNGLVQLLSASPDMQVVGAAGDGEEAVAVGLAQEPDVVLMDLSMPARAGADIVLRS